MLLTASLLPVGNGPSYDVSEWPIVQSTLPRLELSVAAYQAHLQELKSCMYSGGKPCVLLLDVRRHPPLNAIQRKLTADFAIENERTHPGLLRGVAFVSSSALTRGAFTAVAWMLPTSYPRQTFETLADAKLWLSALLRR